MVNLQEINDEISTLEASRTSYTVCERLAMLYTVRDHLNEKQRTQLPQNREQYSRQAVSEFVSVAQKAHPDILWSVLDEHMEMIKVLYPKEYDAVIIKLQKE